ncbi:hypothetical protein GRI58_06985 [Porphyrobacter algicida]|uniref:Uncharacterized protein n=1 Tax=Qipengyuania algicida TaxID=1836209 RepID=A0A845AFZ9_9SPHN|nr:hypothetical protein [Qipengyuania algicida]MXP28564.1 hypothetical protein [Qipengyuania algicida]
MSVVTILVTLVLAFLAWKVVTGIIKFGLIALIVGAAIWVMAAHGSYS